MSLRDTLVKFIPTAYVEKIDNSGNKHNFLWHRDMSEDTLKVKVFYDGDLNQSMHKIWKRTYLISK